MVCSRRLVVGFLILVAGIVGAEEPAAASGAPFAVRMGFRVAADAGREEPLLLRTGTKQAGFTVEVSTRGVAVWTPQGKHGRWEGRVATGEHELILRARRDAACVVLDGARRLSLPATPPPGRPQAAVKPGKGIVPMARARVQRLGEIHFADDFARDPNAVSLWETTGGHFALNASRTPGASQGAFDFWGVAPGGRGLAVAKGSHWFWNDCEVAVSGRGSADSAWGLVTGYRDAKNWRAVVVDPRSRVVRVVAKENGKEQVLHSEDLPVQAGQWYRLTMAMHDGWGAAFLNGHRLLAGEDSRLTGGRIGLLVETSAGGTAGAGFDDLVVRSLDSPGRDWVPPSPFGPSETNWADFSQKDFSADQFMTQWAHPRAFWDEKAEGLDWFRTRFFHDLRFVWQRSNGQRIAYPLQIALFAETGKPDSGYRLVLEAKRVALFRAGKQVGSAPHSLPQVASVEFAAMTGQIRILLDGKEAVSWRDPAPLTSGRVGAKLGRTYGLNVGRADWRDTTRVESSHRIDYGFDRAPVAWESPDAVWRATHRWACVPKWSFFGGRGGPAGNGAESANATLWNLRQFKGDFDLELFIAPMEGTPQRVHFASPANINVVFGATNTDYDSGYLLNFGLYDTPTRLFRAGKEIAKWDGRVDPSLRRHAMPLYHKVTRVWQQIRIQRRGPRILVDVAKHSDQAGFLGMERVFDLQDSAPLNGQRLGIWSHGPNGLALARATVSFAESPGAIPLIVAKAPPRAANGPKRARTVVNPVSGGAHPLWLEDLPEDLARTGVLACPIRISADQHTSLFVHLRGQVAEVVLTGPMGGRETTVPLGRGLPETYRPGTWTKLSFDLGTALRKHFPAGPLIPTAIGFDSPYTSFAEIAGLGANWTGGYLQVGDVTWRAGTQDVKPERALALHIGEVEPVRPEWSTFGGSDGAAVRREADGSIRLLNRRVGGPAGASMSWAPFAVAAFPRLVFEYRFPESVEVNLLVEANGQRFEIQATGVDQTWPMVGEIPNFRADGAWHRAEVDLQAMLARRFRQNGPIVVSGLLWADTKRMSTPRIAYWLRNVALVPAVDPAKGLGIKLSAGAEGGPIQAIAQVLDNNPATVPAAKATGKGGKLDIAGDPKATFLHVRAQFADGSWGEPLHVPLLAAPVPPQAANYRPPAPKAPPPGAPLLAPRVSYIPSDRLCFNDFELGETPETYGEAALGEFRIRRGAWVEAVTPAVGSRCVQFTNLAPSSFFSAYFRTSPWNLERWPRVAFDYRFEQPGCNLNLSLLINEGMTIVEWTGPNGRHNYFSEAVVGSLPAAKQDGKWHRVEFDLRRMVYGSRFPDAAKRGLVTASELSCWATNRNAGGYVNPAAARLKIDNFTIFSPRGTAPEFRWITPGPPAKGYATALDHSPDTVPVEKADTDQPRRQYRDLTPGEWWFHVRTQHKDGRWSPAGHLKVVIGE